MHSAAGQANETQARLMAALARARQRAAETKKDLEAKLAAQAKLKTRLERDNGVYV